MIDQHEIAEVLQFIRSRFFGKYAGKVVDNEDTSKRGRVKVSVPAVYGPKESVWAMPCVPYAGADVGFYCMPEKDSGVWVEFEAGDPSRPIWVGCFWADGELPEKAGPVAKVWQTKAGRIRQHNDDKTILTESKKGAKMTLSNKALTEMSTSKHTVESSAVKTDVGGKNMTLDAAKLDVNGGALEVL
jgi:uncharacterized protein involved in type VI secretion and phage assembly